MTCPNCATEASPEDRFCPRCGKRLAPALALSQGLSPEGPYGGFWRRVAAALLDGIAVELLTGVFAFVAGIFIFIFSPAPLEETSAVLPTPIALPVGIVIGWLYFALLESSRRQATLGKRVLGLAVIDTDGERLSFARASGRHFARFLSIAIFFLGFVMVAFTKRRQALHDLVARTLVARLPR